MKRKTFYYILFILLSILILFNCNENENLTEPNNSGNNPTAQNYGILFGRVSSESGSLLGNVLVRVQNKTTFTNEQGWFSVSELTAISKQSVSFTKAGYLNTYKVVDITVGQSSFIDATLTTESASQSLSNTTETTLFLNDGATVFFQPNSFTDLNGNPYNGSAIVNAKYFDASSATYNQVFPGNFSGITLNGSEVPLQSFGSINVNLKSITGTNLKLASGKTSTLSIPIPTSLQSQAPSTIPMWWYDTTAAVWKEEGTANKVGNNYIGTVIHFTSWNWSRFYDVCYVKGRVIDNDGNPIQYSYATADGVDYAGQSYKYSGADGSFTIGVRVGSIVKIKATKDGTTSSLLTVTTPTTNAAIKDIGDLILAPPIAAITLKWDAIPYDVDSHLYIPAYNSQGPGHIYWNSKGSTTSYPYAYLDTDDKNGYGPEVITIFRKLPGVYKYIVHNYSGELSAPLASSNANVTLIFGGSLYSFNIPVSNPNGYDTWRVFELNVGTNGEVTINTINDFQPSTTSLPKMTLLKK